MSLRPPKFLFLCLVLSLLPQWSLAAAAGVLPAGERFFATACVRPKAIFEILPGGLLLQGGEHGLCATDLAISLDGRFLVPSADPGQPTSSIYEVDRHSGETRRLTTGIYGNVAGIEVAPADLVLPSGEVVTANTLLIEAGEHPLQLHALDLDSGERRIVYQRDHAERGRGIAIGQTGTLQRLTLGGFLETVDLASGQWQRVDTLRQRPMLCDLRTCNVDVLAVRADGALVTGCEPFVTLYEKSRYPFRSLLYGLHQKSNAHARAVRVSRLVQGLETLRLWPVPQLVDEVALHLGEARLQGPLYTRLERHLALAAAAAGDGRHHDMAAAWGHMAEFAAILDEAGGEMAADERRPLARATASLGRVLKLLAGD